MAYYQSIQTGLLSLLILGNYLVCDDPYFQDRLLAESETQEQQELTLRDSVRHTFIGEIGISEQGGDNEGDRIGEYLATTGLDEGYAWCAALTSWGFTNHDVDNPQSAWSPDWFPDSKTIYSRDSQKDEEEWLPTDVIGLWFQSKGRIAHVGAIDTAFNNTVISIEGNTSDYSEREGDRVMRKRRYKRQIHSVSRYIPASESSRHSNVEQQ